MFSVWNNAIVIKLEIIFRIFLQQQFSFMIKEIKEDRSGEVIAHSDSVSICLNVSDYV